MTKSIKIVLIIVGFIIIVIVKGILDEVAHGGGVIWVIILFAYLSYAKAIWKYKKKTDEDTRLDKSL